ncbi:MAG: hypothetical protein V3T70_11885 [Phycisphaerae bacterium]
MATESPCSLRIGREQYNGTARLESEHIDFAGTTKFRFRFSEIRNPGQSDGGLTFNFHGNSVRMDIGARTTKWLESILHPKTLSEKLGVRAGQRVRLLNFEDAELIAEFRARKVRVILHETSDPVDLIILMVERPSELRQIQRLFEGIQPDGCIWVLMPKTSKTVSHANVLAVVRQLGLSNTKTISYSDAYAADRIMLSVDKRVGRQGNGRTTRTARRRVVARA